MFNKMVQLSVDMWLVKRRLLPVVVSGGIVVGCISFLLYEFLVVLMVVKGLRLLEA